MSLIIQSNSLLTTIQDLGRSGSRSTGVNPNGAMDKTALRLINILLGNAENEAVLEIHFPAPKIQFEENTLIALGGADFGAKIDDQTIENWRPYFIEKNQTLHFTKKISGHRIYLSVRGSFKIKDWRGSKSTNLKAQIGGFNGRKLQKDDRIFFDSRLKTQDSSLNFRISNTLIPLYSSFPTVRAIVGAEFNKLSKISQTNFLSKKFTVAHNSDRMGFRLNGDQLSLTENIELVSSAVNFGTIQLLPNGQLIILMADHQTTGGYPRLAHIISEDLPLVAQLGENDSLYIKIISIEDAENLALKFERDLNLLKTACRFQINQ
jgi:antagonist of KipI